MTPTPHTADRDATIYCGDSLTVLRELPSASVDCVATSPPFFGLRDYGTGTWEGGDEECDHIAGRAGREHTHSLTTQNDAGDAFRNSRRFIDADASNYAVCPKCGARRVDQQIGLEATPDEWAARLVAVFRECRRVLRDHGTLWVECGDSYVSGQGGRQSAVGELQSTTRFDRKEAGVKREGLPSSFGERDVGPRFYPGRDTGMKPKDLIGQPFLLAFALRADGWYWRGCNIWAKPNAMPESAKDRCTVAHSYVLHFSKRARYYFDSDAIAEPAAWERWGAQTTPKHNGTQTASGWIPERTKAELLGKAGGSNAFDHKRAENIGDGRTGLAPTNAACPASKHPRSVWTIPTQGFPGAHFATWPEALARRIILAGCPEWVCAVCGRPRERITDGATYYQGRDESKPLRKYAAMGGGHGGVGRGPKSDFGASIAQTVGWSDCGHNAYQPGTILDPFLGSGTTALVARKHGRRCVGIELNEEYAQMAARRLSQLSLLAEATP